MDETSDYALTLLFIVIGLLMTLLAGAVVLFVVYYQQRMLRLKAEQQKKEADFQKELLRASIQSQESERSRIARELHDGVGAMLSTIRLQVSVNAMKDARPPAESDALKGLLDETIDSVRNISRDLLPPTLKEMGLVAALRELLKRVSQATSVQCHAEFDTLPRFKPERELAVFRMVQELINNTLKHAEASNLQLTLEALDGKLLLHYKDDGKGYHHKEELDAGLGLKNLQSRSAFAGGELTMTSEPGEGVSVRLELPINEQNKNL